MENVRHTVGGEPGEVYNYASMKERSDFHRPISPLLPFCFPLHSYQIGGASPCRVGASAHDESDQRVIVNSPFVTFALDVTTSM
jgi:hypothetical protein